MWSAPAIAFVVSLLPLLLRVPVDVGPRDTGELTAAAWVLGVSHPTGSPLGLLLQLLASFVPVGTIVFRHGLVMAFSTALSAALVAGLASDETAPRSRKLAVGLMVGAAVLAPTLLRAATMTEVYAPTLLLVALALSLLKSEPGRGRAFALGALAGLALSAHPTARLFLPVVVLAAWSEERRSAGGPGLSRTFGPLLAGGLSTAPLLLYVPVAASRLPPLSWGDARTPAAFFRHFAASDLRATFAERTTIGHLGADLVAYGRTTLLDLGVPLLSLGVLGLVLLAQRRPRSRALVALSACVIVDIAYGAKLNPMGIPDRQVGHVALLGLAGLGAFFVAEVAALGRASVALAAVATAGLLARAEQELRFDEGALIPRLFTVPGGLARLPPRALLICDGDDSCGGLLYAQLVEGARPDVGVLPRAFADRPGYLAARLVGVRAALEPALTEGSRAVFVQGGDKAYPFPLAGSLARPFLEARPPAVVGVQTQLSALDAALCGAALSACSPLTRWVLAQAHLGPIAAAVAARDHRQAEALATLALALDPSFASLWNNRAVARASRGDLAGALADVDRALELDPTRVPALVNRASWLLALGDLGAASAAVARLSAVCEDCVPARILGVALLVKQGRAPLDALEALVEERRKRPDLYCRAFALIGAARPASCPP